MAILTYILLAVILVSLLSFIGVVTLVLTQKRIKNILFALVSFAAGALLATAFLDLIPEALERASTQVVFLSVLAGLAVFFVLEKSLYWYHCHGGKCDHNHGKPHAQVKLPVAYLNLFGDGIHNFLDGIIIATSFLVSVPLGMVTSLAVIFHELPQEIGDFGILVYGGFSKAKALFYNFLSALTAILGALVAYYFGTTVENALSWLIPFAAGGFIYIATVDLLPELYRTRKAKRVFSQTVCFLLGIVVIWAVTQLFVH